MPEVTAEALLSRTRVRAGSRPDILSELHALGRYRAPLPTLLQQKADQASGRGVLYCQVI